MSGRHGVGPRRKKETVMARVRSNILGRKRLLVILGAFALVGGLLAAPPASGDLRSDLRDEVWHQDISGIAGASQPATNFGNDVAFGDFNGDGFADLASGIPGDTIGGNAGAGAVSIIYGTANGLDATDDPALPSELHRDQRRCRSGRQLRASAHDR